MAVNSFLVATLMLVIVMCRDMESLGVAGDPNVSDAGNGIPYPDFRYACAVKCAEKCFVLPNIPQKVQCAAACMLSCRNIPSSDEVTSCTLDCAESYRSRFLSDDGGKKMKKETYEEVEKLGSFIVNVCYEKCNR